MELNQRSFRGGMNLLADDTRPSADVEGDVSTGSQSIAINQYRIGFDTRCRYDVLESVLAPKEDKFAPFGLKQALVAFGNYEILFCAGYAYYKLFTEIAWVQINGFQMSTTAPRYWTIAVPVNETNYARVGVAPTGATGNSVAAADGGISLVNVNGVLQGQLAGLLVQDNINQPQFIFINSTGQPQGSVTQTYAQWTFTWDSDLTSATYGTVSVDERSYVPIGNFMEIYNGILFIVLPDLTNIARSVSGRPLDFVVNVDINGQKGGDATTTSFSVGASGITCIKSISNTLFVSAGISCFGVAINNTPMAQTIFGEYTFLKPFLFTATCLTDRAIIDINGDTAFVDVSGLRTFNAILQSQNEGRNSTFSKTVSSLFTGIQQVNGLVAAVTFDNYAIFAVNTTYGQVALIYDTITQVYASVDTQQYSVLTGIKQFAAVDTSVIALFAITQDDKVIQLYAGPESIPATARLMSVCSQMPKQEVKQTEFRCVLSEFVEDSTVTLTTFVNNRISGTPQTKVITFVEAQPLYDNIPFFSDANSQVSNLLFSTPNCGQGWKVFNVLQWTGGGKITNVETFTQDVTPMNPLLSQANTK